MADCHKSSDIFDATLHSKSSIIENADIFISQVLEFLLFADPETWEEIAVPLGFSDRLSSACKHDIIETSTPSAREFSVNELLPKFLLNNLAIERIRL
jgi:hypothetical protein